MVEDNDTGYWILFSILHKYDHLYRPQVPSQYQNALMVDDEYGAFRWACRKGNVSIAKWIQSLAGSSAQNAMLLAVDCDGFRRACKNEHEVMARWLYAMADADTKQQMIQEYAKNPDTYSSHRLINLWLSALCDDSINIPEAMKQNCTAAITEALPLFANGNIPITLPNENDISQSARCFADVAHKLKLLKNAYPEIDPTTMLGITAPKRTGLNVFPDWKKINQETTDITHSDVGAILDSVKEITRYAALYQLSSERDATTLKMMDETALNEALTPLQHTFAKRMLEGRTLPQLQKMSNLWHKSRIGLLKSSTEKEQTLRDFPEQGAWKHITEHIETPCTQEGLTNYRLVALTTAQDLQNEHNTHGHCVDGYVDACKKGTMHVFSIQKKIGSEWVPMTTLGCELEGNGTLSTDENYHQGKDRRAADAEEKAVADWFMGGVNKGEIAANLQDVGEIPTDTTISPIENALGLSLPLPDESKRLNDNFNKIARLNHSDQGFPFGRAARKMTLATYLNQNNTNPAHSGMKEASPDVHRS